MTNVMIQTNQLFMGLHDVHVRTCTLQAHGCSSLAQRGGGAGGAIYIITNTIAYCEIPPSKHYLLRLLEGLGLM